MAEFINDDIGENEQKISKNDQGLAHPFNILQPFAVYVICRLGNDSQLAVNLLKDRGFNKAKDVRGGLAAWSKLVDKEFPLY